jgi:hypothetical protein
MIDPKEFSDMSDYPQDGYGNINLDHRYPEKIESEEETEEVIPDEDWIVHDDDDDTDI